MNIRSVRQAGVAWRKSLAPKEPVYLTWLHTVLICFSGQYHGLGKLKVSDRTGFMSGQNGLICH